MLYPALIIPVKDTSPSHFNQPIQLVIERRSFGTASFCPPTAIWISQEIYVAFIVVVTGELLTMDLTSKCHFSMNS